MRIRAAIFPPRRHRLTDPVLTYDRTGVRAGPPNERGSAMSNRAGLRPWLCLTPAILTLLVLLPVHSVADSPPVAQPPKGPLRSLTVYPSRVALSGPRDKQQLIVLGEYGD